jgi:uncharacterized protein YdhG (YjbR/CyaY superfamily)
MTAARPKDIDAYIAECPDRVRGLLDEVRATIRRAAPDAVEAMRYGIPTFVLHENLVHFAAFKSHIGFYPTPSGIAAFSEELASYKSAKGSVRFPMDKPLPLELIEKIVRFRVTAVNAKVGGGRRS